MRKFLFLQTVAGVSIMVVGIMIFMVTMCLYLVYPDTYPIPFVGIGIGLVGWIIFVAACAAWFFIYMLPSMLRDL